MFGLPESSSDSIVTSVKDDYKLKCLHGNQITLSPTGIVNIVQLGSKNTDKNRPLLTRCFNKNKKWKFKDQENVKIWTTPDLTTKEREERKRLRATFKKQKKNGETNLRIGNNKIVMTVSENNMNKPFHGMAQTIRVNLFQH